LSPLRKSPVAEHARNPAEWKGHWLPPPGQPWQRLTVAEGEKVPRTYDWAYARIVESRDALPGPDTWLLARRSPDDPTDIACYLSSASGDTPLLTLARVASSRYGVEQVIEEGKGETGLDEYEVRYWHSWHRHITLAMMAHAWLVSIRCKAAKKGRARVGRTERSGGATVAGGSLAPASSLRSALSGLVALAASQAATGLPQPLSVQGLQEPLQPAHYKPP